MKWLSDPTTLVYMMVVGCPTHVWRAFTVMVDVMKPTPLKGGDGVPSESSLLDAVSWMVLLAREQCSAPAVVRHLYAGGHLL